MKKSGNVETKAVAAKAVSRTTSGYLLIAALELQQQQRTATFGEQSSNSLLNPLLFGILASSIHPSHFPPYCCA